MRPGVTGAGVVAGPVGVGGSVEAGDVPDRVVDEGLVVGAGSGGVGGGAVVAGERGGEPVVGVVAEALVLPRIVPIQDAGDVPGVVVAVGQVDEVGGSVPGVLAGPGLDAGEPQGGRVIDPGPGGATRRGADGPRRWCPEDRPGGIVDVGLVPDRGRSWSGPGSNWRPPVFQTHHRRFIASQGVPGRFMIAGF